MATSETQHDFLRRGYTRRSFGKLATLITGGAVLPFSSEFALAQRSMIMGDIPPDAVMINGNENPMGPCPEAAEAAHKIIAGGGRYHFEKTFMLRDTAAESEGLKPDYVMPFAGSSDPLLRVVMAFCSPQKGFVAADPGYEAGAMTAEYVGAKVSRVPLVTDSYAHDVKAMAKADPNAGVIYVCNPNNPSGTLTPRSDIEYLLENKPKGSILLLDEAYIHIAHAHTCQDLVVKDKDVIILRTFSKLYGMAGMRAGLAMGRPDLLKKLGPLGSRMTPTTGMVAAAASLKVKNLVPERRKIIKDIRDDVFSFLDGRKIKFIPSDSNCFMLDTKRPASEFAQAMAAKKVYVGRSWPVWQTYSRITVGSKDDMEKFKKAAAEVMG